MKNKCVYGILGICLLVVCVIWYYCFFPSATRVILVRHAERLNSTDTSSLSLAGLQRAGDLAHVIESAGVTRIFTSDQKRAIQTGAPSGAALGIAPVQIPMTHIGAFVDSIKAHRGEVILVVGHSDTVPLILEGLGISPPPLIGPSEFDNMFVVVFSRCRLLWMHLKYGRTN